MFWGGNYIVLNDVNFLMKEENIQNVSLTQVLEADDILTECRADNTALRQFLTKPEIRAELITLITEEPSKSVELSTQYRHAHIASEVLSSQLPTLRDRLAMDTVQMNRLCDFVNKDPPLNPLLASFFSKTIEMLFERSPKQDWYAHHIICLHVLDFFKSRRDFLPNLLRHISTSAICDVFKCFFGLQDPFNKIIMEWLDEHQILENFIHIICGTYEIEEPQPISATPTATDREKGQAEINEKVVANHNDNQHPSNGTDPDTNSNKHSNAETNSVTREEYEQDENKREAGVANEEVERALLEERAGRVRDVASANAAALLCEAVLNSCAGDIWPPNTSSWAGSGAGAAVCARLRSEAGVRALLAGAFTAPAASARVALLHAARLLLALLAQPEDSCSGDSASGVERVVAPHVPLLHHALLRPPRRPNTHQGNGGRNEKEEEGVGAARVAVAAVLARLARAEALDVFTALLSLGTASVLIDMLFAYPENNFLHAQVLAFVSNALANRLFGDRYAAHLVEECDLLTRLMDAFEENEDKLFATSRSRAGHMGHVVSMLRVLHEAGVAPLARAQRWETFREARLRPHLQRLDTPLGGVHPSDNQYDMESAELPGSYELGEVVEGVECAEVDEAAEEAGEGGGDEPAPGQQMHCAERTFLSMAEQRYDDMWGEDEAGPDESVVQQVLTEVSPWECCESGGSGGDTDAGWAHFTDAFATSDWPVPEPNQQAGMDRMQMPEGDNLQDALTIELAQKMLTAFSCLGRSVDEPPADPSAPSADLRAPCADHPTLCTDPPAPCAEPTPGVDCTASANPKSCAGPSVCVDSGPRESALSDSETPPCPDPPTDAER